MQRTFDVQAVREQFPALGRTHNGRGVVYFDGPGGSQVARQAIDAISGYMRRSPRSSASGTAAGWSGPASPLTTPKKKSSGSPKRWRSS
jgi:selenocysteine lyase/cysteine desulfurase